MICGKKKKPKTKNKQKKLANRSLSKYQCDEIKGKTEEMFQMKKIVQEPWQWYAKQEMGVLFCISFNNNGIIGEV